MALIECYECGKEISSIATACPHCGAPSKNQQAQAAPVPAGQRMGPFKKLAVIIFWGFVGLIAFGWWSADQSSSRTTSSVSYMANHSTYEEVDRLVGCASTFSDDKKNDIFNERFKDRWLTWSGKIELLEADSVSLNVDGVGLQDLSVTFRDKGAGYDLRKGQIIKVGFVMRRAGGCFLPYSGVLAEIR